MKKERRNLIRFLVNGSGQRYKFAVCRFSILCVGYFSLVHIQWNKM
jgi:hypothetical protein